MRLKNAWHVKVNIVRIVQVTFEFVKYVNLVLVLSQIISVSLAKKIFVMNASTTIKSVPNVQLKVHYKMEHALPAFKIVTIAQ